MKETLQALAEQYLAALGEYLQNSDESALKKAYEIGRKAIGDGVGVVEMASIHQKAVVAALLNCQGPIDTVRIVEGATNFFGESVSSFEMALRGFQAAHRAAEMERQRYQEQFEFAPDAYLVTDGGGIIREANRAASELLRTPQESLIWRPLLAFVWAREHGNFCEQLERLVRGEADRIEDWQTQLEPPDSPPFPAALTASTIRGDDGQLVGLRWLVRDISERRRIERERAQFLAREQVARAEADAARRLAFLAEASTILASSLDYEATLTSVANLAVPYLGDWCFIHVVEANGAIRCLTAVRANRNLFPEVEAPRDWYLSDPRAGEGVPKVLATGRPEIVSPVTDNWLRALTANASQLVLFRRLGFKSAMSAPMLARRRTLGALTFVSAESRRQYDAVEMALCEDLARRCAFATDNARLYRQVIIERDRAEKASRAKDEFLAVLSHEIRNPLMPIMGWARVFKDQELVTQNKVLAEGIGAVERNAQTIQRLVEDCQDLARISEGKISFEPEIVDLNEIATTSVEAVADLARLKGLRVQMGLASSALWLSGDRTRLQQVFVNILRNAIRFTPNGGSISLRSQRVANEAELQVADTGEGISPDFLEQIFEPFRQGTTSWLTSESGLGLGLAIARQIAGMHGGRVWAASQGLNQGSTFFVRFPLVAEQAVVPVTKPKFEAQAKAAPLRVLLVEDAEDIIFLMQIKLEWLGYSFLVARDGQSGLEIAEREHPDVIISDIKMPGLDGYELIAKIRQNPLLRSTPAIALTGFGMKGDVERALAEGYDAHMIKPADINELSSLIQKLTPQREGGKEGREEDVSRIA